MRALLTLCLAFGLMTVGAAPAAADCAYVKPAKNGLAIPDKAVVRPERRNYPRCAVKWTDGTTEKIAHVPLVDLVDAADAKKPCDCFATAAATGSATPLAPVPPPVVVSIQVINDVPLREQVDVVSVNLPARTCVVLYQGNQVTVTDKHPSCELALSGPAIGITSREAWAAIDTQTVSKAGVAGVYFLSASGRTGKLVVKEQHSIVAEAAGNKFLRAKRFLAPDVILLAKTTPDGQLLTRKSGELAAQNPRSMRSRSGSRRPLGTKAIGYYMIVDLVTGKVLPDMESEAELTALRSDAVLKEIGRIAVYDLMMGNPDRLFAPETNADNLMFAGGLFVPIDNGIRIGDMDHELNAVFNELDLRAAAVRDQVLRDPSDRTAATTLLVAAGMRQAITEIAADADTLLAQLRDAANSLNPGNADPALKLELDGLERAFAMSVERAQLIKTRALSLR